MGDIAMLNTLAVVVWLMLGWFMAYSGERKVVPWTAPVTRISLVEVLFLAESSLSSGDFFF